MKYLELKATLRFQEEILNWVNISSTIRGTWGRTLKKLYCLQRNIACDECGMNNCTYYNIFEKKFGDYEQYHPYIIYPEDNSGYEVNVTFKFYGWLCSHYEKLLLSLVKLTEIPVIVQGRRIFYELLEITDGTGKKLFEINNTTVFKPNVEEIAYLPKSQNSVLINFVTPFRQKHNGHLLSEFRPTIFALGVYKRLKFFNEHFGDKMLNLPDYLEVDQLKVINSDIQWTEKLRKSYRQNALMSLGGLTGSVQIINLSPEIYGVLAAGERLHCGKQTTFGNGKYVINH